MIYTNIQLACYYSLFKQKAYKYIVLNLGEINGTRQYTL